MTNPLLSFLRDVVSRAQAFGQVTSHIHLRERDGEVIAKIPSTDGSVQIESTATGQIDLGDARACLGNLPYLNTLLNSTFVDPSTKVVISTGERNGKLMVRSIQFTSPNRFEVTYVASDPFRESIMMPTSVKVEEWPVTFVVTPDILSDISEMKKVFSTIPSGGTEDMFRLVCSQGGDISMEFGSESHTSVLYLDTEVESSLDKPLNLFLTTSQFLTALLMSIPKGKPKPKKTLKSQKNQNEDDLEDTPAVLIQMAEDAVRVIAESPDAIHKITLTRRRTRNE